MESESAQKDLLHSHIALTLTQNALTFTVPPMYTSNAFTFAICSSHMYSITYTTIRVRYRSHSHTDLHKMFSDKAFTTTVKTLTFPQKGSCIHVKLSNTHKNFHIHMNLSHSHKKLSYLYKMLSQSHKMLSLSHKAFAYAQKHPCNAFIFTPNICSHSYKAFAFVQIALTFSILT